MRRLFALALTLAAPLTHAAELRGHGGPVRALAVQDGLALTGSFDSTAILWSAADGSALQVLRFHQGGVTAVAFFDGGFVTGGEDGRVALWTRGAAAPSRIAAEHGAPVAALAVSADGTRLASAGWDGSVRLIGPAGAAILPIGAPVNAAAFLADGRLAVAAQDLTLLLLDAGGAVLARTRTPAPVNALAAAGDGVAAAGADGVVRLFDGALAPRGAADPAAGPLVGLTAAPDGARLAASSVTGAVAVVEVAPPGVSHVFAEVGPVWSLAFAENGAVLLAGGGDRVVRRWDAATGAPLDRSDVTTVALDADLGDSRGAQVFRACVACHALGPDDAARAGPTLHGVFGRRIGTAAGYAYSQALRDMDLIWTPETVAALFEHGPAAYTPGTRMPEQRILSAQDRAALVAFLAERTR